MAFPSVRSSIVTNGTTATASPVVNLPATVRAGDTILVKFRSALAGAVTFPGAAGVWNELVDASPDAADDQLVIAWKKADGSESGTTITLSAANAKFCAIAHAIRDAADPTLRPPEMSTVAIGTTPAQPNATTVTPTGGAKDYMWLTVYSMEGEQTGVTTYPASFTLDQNFANSGTAGAVGTNVTMGAAERQLNAASMDAGAWVVGGTLDDWSAYTIAVHPAEAVPAPLQTEFTHANPLPKKTLGTTLLTIASTILTTTLSIPSIKAAEMPVPQRAAPQTHTWTQNLLQTTLAPTGGPFNQYDWPNPARPPWLLVDSSSLPDESTSADAPFAQRDWPNPAFQHARRMAPTWTQSPAVPEPAPPEAAPFFQTDWPNPPLSKRRFQSTVEVLPGIPPFPFASGEWPNPAVLRRPTLTWTQSPAVPEAAPDATPFTPNAWALPLRATAGALTHLGTRTPDLLAEPFFQAPGPNPAPVRPLALTHLGTRPPGLLAEPFRQTEWPLPRFTARPTLTHLGTRPPGLLAEPFRQTDWPNPAPARDLALTWHSSRAPGLVDAVPAHQTDWPNPAPARRLALSWSSTRALGLVDAPTHFTPTWVTPPRVRRADVAFVHPSTVILAALTTAPSPFTPVLFPNPAPRRYPNVGFTAARPQFYVDAPTAFRADWPNPAVRPSALTGLVPNLLVSTLSGVAPFSQLNWPNPAPARRLALTHVGTRVPDLLAEPFRQTDWSNPVRPRPGPPLEAAGVFPALLVSPVGARVLDLPTLGVRPALTWTQGHLLLTTLTPAPVGAQLLTLPAPARAAALTWLDNRLGATLADHGAPFVPVLFPNPAPARVLALTWIQSPYALGIIDRSNPIVIILPTCVDPIILLDWVDRVEVELPVDLGPHVLQAPATMAADVTLPTAVEVDLIVRST